MSKTLVVFYSWSNGNTKRIAQKAAKALNADIMQIDTAKPYEGSYDDVVYGISKEETSKHYKPELKPYGKSIADYDKIIIGTPTWWYTMAPAVLSFLSVNDFSGKKVALFSTHGGWPGHTIKDMEKECKDADVYETMTVQFDSTGGSSLVTPESEIDAWIDKL